MNQLGNVRTAQAVCSRAATRLRRWQRVFRSALALGLLSFATSASAIGIGEGVNGPFTFDSAPTTADWTTASLAGGGATYTTQAALDAAIQALDATGITTALPTDPAVLVPPNGPGTNALARWHQELQGIATRPTGNAATVLLGKLTNTHANYITDMSISLDVAKYNLQAVNDLALEGLALYYSGTGLPNSWTSLGIQGEFSPATWFVNDLGTSFGGNTFYLLFADDNGDGFSDQSYLMDNLTIETAVGPDPWDPPPPPTPEYGSQLPPAANSVGAGDLDIASQVGGAVLDESGNNVLQLNNASLSLTTEQVDLRSVDTIANSVHVSIDLRTLDTSDGSDFETGDSIQVVAEWSADGLNFEALTLYDQNGGNPGDPAVWPAADDELKFLDTGAGGAFTTVGADLPANAETVRVKVTAINNSASETFFFDNLSVTVVPVPEPGTVAMFGLGMIGLVGYARRRRGN